MEVGSCVRQAGLEGVKLGSGDLPEVLMGLKGEEAGTMAAMVGKRDSGRKMWMLGSFAMDDWEGTHDFPLSSFITIARAPLLNWVLTEGAWSPCSSPRTPPSQTLPTARLLTVFDGKGSLV